MAQFGMGKKIIKGVGQHLAEDHVKSTMQGKQSLASKIVTGPQQPKPMQPRPMPQRMPAPKPNAPQPHVTPPSLNMPKRIIPLSEQKPLVAELRPGPTANKVKNDLNRGPKPNNRADE